MNLKELNEIFNTQLCMLDKSEGNNPNTVVHGTGSKHPDPDALVLYYDKKGYYKIGKGREYFFVKEEYPGLDHWYILPDDFVFLDNKQLMYCNEEYCEPDLYKIIHSMQQHQDANIHTDEQNNNRE